MAAEDRDVAVLASLQARHFAARADHGPEAFHLFLHLIDETGSIDAYDAGIVLDPVGVVDLSAGDHLLEDERLEPVPGRIQGASQTGRARADDDHIIDRISHSTVLPP